MRLAHIIRATSVVNETTGNDNVMLWGSSDNHIVDGVSGIDQL